MCECAFCHDGLWVHMRVCMCVWMCTLTTHSTQRTSTQHIKHFCTAHTALLHSAQSATKVKCANIVRSMPSYFHHDIPAPSEGAHAGGRRDRSCTLESVRSSPFCCCKCLHAVGRTSPWDPNSPQSQQLFPFTSALSKLSLDLNLPLPQPLFLFTSALSNLSLSLNWPHSQQLFHFGSALSNLSLDLNLIFLHNWFLSLVICCAHIFLCQHTLFVCPSLAKTSIPCGVDQFVSTSAS
jgi:hypothetical protein